jgi:hypothetical protein
VKLADASAPKNGRIRLTGLRRFCAIPKAPAPGASRDVGFPKGSLRDKSDLQHQKLNEQLGFSFLADASAPNDGRIRLTGLRRFCAIPKAPAPGESRNVGFPKGSLREKSDLQHQKLNKQLSFSVLADASAPKRWADPAYSRPKKTEA